MRLAEGAKTHHKASLLALRFLGLLGLACCGCSMAGSRSSLACKAALLEPAAGGLAKADALLQSAQRQRCRIACHEHLVMLPICLVCT